MFSRLSIYLKEMFPFSAFAGTVMLVFAVTMTIGRLSGYPPEFHYYILLTGIAVSSVSLLIRIMDEFKDFEDDLRNFPDRPLPSGKVKPQDLKILAWSCVFIFLAISVYINPKALFLWALFILFFSFLMLKWFFIESRMRKNLLMAFFTHHPIVFLNYIYILIASLSIYSEGVRPGVAKFLLPICLIFTNWEISRKIRTPSEETEYSTYSKVLGPRFAVSIALVLQMIVIGSVLTILNELGIKLPIRITFGIVMLLLMTPYFRYAWDLKIIRSLKKMAEDHIFAVMVFLMVAVFV